MKPPSCTRLLWQVVAADVQRQLDAAVVREAWEDAEVLQQELTAVTGQLAAASRPYNFEPADAQDLLDRLQPQPGDTASASDERGPATSPDANSAAQIAVAPSKSAHDSVGAPRTTQQQTPAPDPGEAGSVDRSAGQPMLPIAAAAAEVLVGGRIAGLVPSASGAWLEEGYAADSDSSVSVLKLSQSAVDVAASMQLPPHETGSTAAAAPEHEPEVVAAASPHEVQSPTRTAEQAAGSEQPPHENAMTPDQHNEGVGQQDAVGHSSDSVSSQRLGPQGHEDAQQSAERADASAGPCPNTVADAVDSRTESSADGLTPSVSRTYLDGYAADSDTSIGGRNRPAAHSVSAGGPLGSADKTPRPVRANSVAVSPIPEGEQLPTGVPAELPPPAPPLNMLDRHDSGNLADAEDELPGDQQSHHTASVGHVEATEDGDRSVVRTSDEGTHQPLAGVGDVQAEQAGMFAGLDLA